VPENHACEKLVYTPAHNSLLASLRRGGLAASVRSYTTESPRPHFKPGCRIVGMRDDPLFVVVVDHAPEIPSLISGAAEAMPLVGQFPEVAQFFEPASCPDLSSRRRRTAVLDQRGVHVGGNLDRAMISAAGLF